MLPLFWSFAASVWWNYSDSELADKLSQSAHHPIFAVFYTDYCPKCYGMHERVEAYSQRVGESSPIVFTKINCGNTDLCQKAGIKGIPVFMLLRGKDRRYWVQTEETADPGWNDFLKKETGDPVANITAKRPLDKFLPKTFSGSTHFHLRAPTGDTDALRGFREAAYHLRVYGCTFSYEKCAGKMSVRAYHSPSCFVKSRSRNFREFMEANKFSSFHQYDEEEVDALKPPFALFVSEVPIVGSQYDALEQIDYNFCRSLRIGYTLTPSRYAEAKANKSDLEPPFLVLVKSEGSEPLVWKKRLVNAVKSGFIDRELNGLVDFGPVTVAVLVLFVFCAAGFPLNLLYFSKVPEDKLE